MTEIGLRFTRGERLNYAPSGKRFFCNFIEPGLVSYEDCGGDTELLRKETIDAALATAIGNPLTVRHVPTNIAQVELERVSRGEIDKVGYNAETGWYFCEGPVTDDHARQLLRANDLNRPKPSCGYTVLEFGPGGVYHNIPFAREITKIKFHHLAIVDNPRYEGADIRLNSKTPMTNPLKWLRKKLVPATATAAETTVEETGEIAADATIEIDGKQVRFNELADAHRKKLDADKLEADRVAKEKADKDAAAARENGMTHLNGDDEVEVDGKKVKMNALIDCFRVYGCRENEADKKKDDDEKRENALREKAEKDRIAAEAARENGTKHYRVLQGARTADPVVVERTNSANTEQEQIRRGEERYGSAALHQKN